MSSSLIVSELKNLLGTSDAALAEVLGLMEESQVEIIYKTIKEKYNRQAIEKELEVKVLERLKSRNIVLPKGITMDQAERTIILSTLEECHGNISQSAQTLGIGRKTLHRKIMEYGILKEVS
jgi:DNA-binding NtrC family response regulator